MYVVIFKSKKKIPLDSEYSKYSEQLRRDVQNMPGYINFENWINEDGYSVSLSYWETEANIDAWKNFPVHQEAKQKAKWNWYHEYSVELCEIKTKYSNCEVNESNSK